MPRYRSKPHRLPRECYRGERTAAFTARCDEWQPLFACPERVLAHVELLTRAAEQYGCIVPVFCFMPDHLHVMFKGLAEASDCLAAMERYKFLSGSWFDKNDLDGWQGNFHDHIVRGYDDWRAHATYIAQNPVRAGLVENAFEYPFPGTIGCDIQDIILGWGAGADGTFRRARNL